MFKYKNKAFTLIELLIVIAIIGILASIIVVSASQARKNARNAKRLADISNYAKAFEMALDENGEYPNPGNTSYHCLGKYEDDMCGLNDRQFISSVLNETLDDFIGLPADDYLTDVGGGNSWCGYIYRCAIISPGDDVCSGIEVTWPMEGNEQSCGVGVTFMPFFGPSTLCQYMVDF